MSNIKPAAIPVTTGKRKRDTYSELAAELEALIDRYNKVVPIYNDLRIQVEKAKLDYDELNQKYQELLRRNRTLESIDWYSDR
jgi:type I restriction-modification system DNA methylase subunit